MTVVAVVVVLVVVVVVLTLLVVVVEMLVVVVFPTKTWSGNLQLSCTFTKKRENGKIQKQKVMLLGIIC